MLLCCCSMHPWVPVSACSTEASCTPSSWRLTGDASVAQPLWKLSRSISSCCITPFPPSPQLASLFLTIDLVKTAPGVESCDPSKLRQLPWSSLLPRTGMSCFVAHIDRAVENTSAHIQGFDNALLCIQACNALERAIVALDSGVLPQSMNPAGASEESMQEIEVRQSCTSLYHLQGSLPQQLLHFN